MFTHAFCSALIYLVIVMIMQLTSFVEGLREYIALELLIDDINKYAFSQDDAMA